HEVDGARAQDAGSVELAAAAQHLAEPEVVGHGRDESATAREEWPRLAVLARGRGIDDREGLVPAAAIVGREPLNVLVRQAKSGVDHAQRLEDLGLQVLVEGLAG